MVSDTSPAIHRRFEIRPGSVVIGLDGEEIGKVNRVVVSPGTGEVKALVVRKGLILHRDVAVPISAVDQADQDVVRLGLAAEEVNQLPEYNEREYVAPPTDWQTATGKPANGHVFPLPTQDELRGLRSARSGRTEISAGGRPIKAGQRVVCRNGEVGKLDLVLIDAATRRATYFVVRQGGLLGRDTIIPVEWASEITRDKIYLDVTREQLHELPEYRPDDEITDDVLDALWENRQLRDADLLMVEVRTTDGVVELAGHTTSEQALATIEATARGVRGVIAVRNCMATLTDEIRRSIEAIHARRIPPRQPRACPADSLPAAAADEQPVVPESGPQGVVSSGA